MQNEVILNLNKLMQKYIEDLVNEVNLKIDNQTFNFSRELKYLHAKSDDYFIKSLKLILESKDAEYAKSKPKGVYITHKNKSKTIMTEYGDLILKRRRYVSKDDGPFYYVDNICGFDLRQRIDKSFQATILKQSIDESYHSVENKFNNRISYITAMNIAKRNEDKIVAINDSKKKKLNEIYIEADEDHISLLDKKRTLVKLLYIHEGYRFNYLTGKNELINPHYISRIKGDIWKEAQDYVNLVYGEDVFVHLNGDGAYWIKSGITYFKNVKFHLDKYHTKYSIDVIASNDLKLKDKLYNIFSLDDNSKKRKELFLIYYSIKENTTASAENRWQYLIANSKYINFNDINSHCSAESHVSHVLSSRMSSRPMAWSIDGADRMARYRALKYNNYDIEELLVGS